MIQTSVHSLSASVIGLNGTIFTSRFSSNLDVFTVGKPQSIIRSKVAESIYRVDRNEVTYMHQAYSGNRGLIVQFWQGLKAETEDDLLKINFNLVSNSTMTQKFLHEPEFIPVSLFSGTGIARLTMSFVAPKNSPYRFSVNSADTYVLFGGRRNETLVGIDLAVFLFPKAVNARFFRKYFGT
ncbi:unnamed protein product [Heterobilharzia americana]|nr:unnamed protein product [Heterobilharzia americana]